MPALFLLKCTGRKITLGETGIQRDLVFFWIIRLCTCIIILEDVNANVY
jgi:hypothetical protein